MQEQKTGIVRRLDYLGRVVLPKEMRKTLRWKDNDPLEMYTVKDELVIKKYSPTAVVLPYAEEVAAGLEGIMEKPCLITDTDAIICATGKCKEAVGKKISDELDKVIRGGKSVLISKSDGGEVLSPIKNEIFAVQNEIIVPVYNKESGYGAVVVFDNENEQTFNAADVRLVRLAAALLAKRFEE